MRQNLKLDPAHERLDVVDRSAPEHGTFFHPLLFLSLASWISLEFYVRVSGMVFAYISSYDPDKSLTILAVDERPGETTTTAFDTTAAAVSEQPSSSSVNITAASSAADPDVNATVINASNSMAEETTTPVAGKQQPSFTFIDESSFASNMSYQNEVVENSSNDAEMELEREKWQLRIDLLEREHQRKLEESKHELEQRMWQKERELQKRLTTLKQQDTELRRKLENGNESQLELRRQLERNEAETSQLRTKLELKEREIKEKEREIEQQQLEVEGEKHAYFLRSTEHKRRVDQLTQQIKELSLTNEQLRMVTLKRNPTVEKQNAIRDLFSSGMDRLEILVITQQPHQRYYGFRRKLKGAFSVINQRLRTSHDEFVVLWFMSNNAKQDFIDCTAFLSQRAEETGVSLKKKHNNIECDESTGADDFDIVCLLRGFAKMTGLYELDAGFLQSVMAQLQQQSRDNQMAKLSAHIGTQSEQMVRDVYSYVLNDYKKIYKY